MNIAELAKAAAQVVECAMCGRRSEDGDMPQCSCETVFYCGTSCQHQHWAVHRPHCSARHQGGSLGSCVNCGLTSQTLKSCICKAALYCSVKCQKEHWGTHRRVCADWVGTHKRTKKKKFSDSVQTEETSEGRIIAEREALRKALEKEKKQRDWKSSDQSESAVNHQSTPAGR